MIDLFDNTMNQLKAMTDAIEKSSPTKVDPNNPEDPFFEGLNTNAFKKNSQTDFKDDNPLYNEADFKPIGTTDDPFKDLETSVGNLDLAFGGTAKTLGKEPPAPPKEVSQTDISFSQSAPKPATPPPQVAPKQKVITPQDIEQAKTTYKDFINSKLTRETSHETRVFVNTMLKAFDIVFKGMLK
jgi:hypothetical protein